MADSNNLTEADILAMAQAADEGRDYNPIPKEDESTCNREGERRYRAEARACRGSRNQTGSFE